MSGDRANPFDPRVVLALLVFGACVFVGLLWMIGAGMTSGNINDGSGHVGGKGLNGYAAVADYLEARGYAVARVRSVAALDEPGLLVLTPTPWTEGKEIAAIVDKRREIGPTLVIAPKWQAGRFPQGAKGVKKGWVELTGTQLPEWKGFRDDITVELKPMRAGGKTARWTGAGVTGELPVSESVESGKGKRMVPIVTGDEDGRVLAAYIDEDGYFASMEDIASDGGQDAAKDARRDLYPLILVFEPDLLDNYGMADAANARLAERIVTAALGDESKVVAFDLTLNGYARSANLLTLAFKPPFLAATLCLLLAAVAVAWRAFNRFGPALATTRAIAFGKRALVGNAAGLIRRTRRYHLIAQPYADAARERLTRALALPSHADPAATEAAIDRALAARHPDTKPFSLRAAALRAARKPHDILRAARELHALERMLTR